MHCQGGTHLEGARHFLDDVIEGVTMGTAGGDRALGCGCGLGRVRGVQVWGGLQ